MKLKITALLVAGFFLMVACGGGKEGPAEPDAGKEEVVETAASLLEKGQKEFDAEQHNLASQSLNRLLEEFPDAEETTKAKELIKEAEEILDYRKTETERIQAQETADLIAALAKVPGEGYDHYYDADVYDIEGSKVYLTFRWSGSGQANIRFVIDHYYGADLSTLSIQRYTMKVGEQPYPIIPRMDQLSTEKQGESVREILDTRPSMAHRGMIEAIVTADKVVLIAEGDERNEERELTAEEKDGLKNVMTAFISIGGIW